MKEGATEVDLHTGSVWERGGGIATLPPPSVLRVHWHKPSFMKRGLTLNSESRRSARIATRSAAVEPRQSARIAARSVAIDSSSPRCSSRRVPRANSCLNVGSHPQ
jgi:hypothetical protein